MLMRIFRFFAGLLLLPVCWAATRTVVVLLQSLRPPSVDAVSPSAWALGGGFLAWLLLYLTLPRPVRTYVFAHELTHALWAAVMGAKVLRMNVSRTKGSVVLSKTNFLITLAPYFFPLYTVLVIFGYVFLSWFFDLQPYVAIGLGLVGFTWGFHFTFTVSTLLQRQSDIQECGFVFSYALIWLMNVLGIALWVVAVSSATLEDMATAMIAESKGAAHFLGAGIVAIFERIRQ